MKLNMYKEKIEVAFEKRIQELKDSLWKNYSVEKETRMSECQRMLLIVNSILDKAADNNMKPKFKVGDTVRRISDGLEAKVISVDNLACTVECADWTDVILDSVWELVEEDPEQVTGMKIFSVSCWKVDDRGRRFSKVVLKHLSTREKANKYKEDFESKWQENLDKKIFSFLDF